MKNRDDYAPGRVDGIRYVAGCIGQTSDVATTARGELLQIAGQTGPSVWEGASADRFNAIMGELPRTLSLMADGYRTVSDALFSYANRLEGIQGEVDRAIRRGHEAEARKQQAESDRGAAASRVSQLTNQLRPVQVHEGAAWTKYQAALVSPMDENAAYQEYLGYVRQRQGIEGQRGNAQSDQRNADGRAKDAQGEINQLNGQLDGLANQRLDGERQCAACIRNALPEGLKDPSLAAQAIGAIADTIGDFAEWAEGLVSALVTGNWGEALYRLRQAMDAMAGILDVLSTILTVVGLVCFVVGAILAFTGVGLPVAAALFAVSQASLQGAELADKASKVLKVASFAIGVGLCLNGYRRPGEDAPAVGRDELMKQGVGLAVELGMDEGMKVGGKALNGKLLNSPTMSFNDNLEFIGDYAMIPPQSGESGAVIKLFAKSAERDAAIQGTEKIVKKIVVPKVQPVIERGVEKGVKGVAEGLADGGGSPYEPVYSSAGMGGW